MLAKIKYGWRWFATAFSFFIFGLGGILIPLIIVPVLYLLIRDDVQREQLGQQFIHCLFYVYIRLMKFMGVLTYEVSGIEKLKDSKLIVANHPSLIDVVFLISFVPNANCIVKNKLARNPVMMGALKVAGYIVNDDVAEDVVTSAAKAFEKGHALIVFPEGTRTTPAQQMELKRGAANIAIRTEVDVTPILIECEPTTLTKADRWYQIPDRRAHFRIQVKDKIKIGKYLGDIKPAKAARVLTNDLSNYFKQELGLHE